VDAYITKPFEPDELLAVITSIFNSIDGSARWRD
jgi:DNA-binding response OmpR family regulator